MITCRRAALTATATAYPSRLLPLDGRLAGAA